MSHLKIIRLISLKGEVRRDQTNQLKLKLLIKGSKKSLIFSKPRERVSRYLTKISVISPLAQIAPTPVRVHLETLRTDQTRALDSRTVFIISNFFFLLLLRRSNERGFTLCFTERKIAAKALGYFFRIKRDSSIVHPRTRINSRWETLRKRCCR